MNETYWPRASRAPWLRADRVAIVDLQQPNIRLVLQQNRRGWPSPAGPTRPEPRNPDHIPPRGGPNARHFAACGGLALARGGQ